MTTNLALGQREPRSFGQLFNIPLEDQIDVQPLVGKVKVTAGPNPGDHRMDVATEKQRHLHGRCREWHGSRGRA